MDEIRNPLLPVAYDIAWSAIGVVLLVLLVVALVSLGRSAKGLTTAAALVWTLLVIFVPVVGPIAWLVIGRRAGLRQAPPREQRKPGY